MNGAPSDDWPNGFYLTSFSRMMSMRLVLCGVGAILKNGFGIYGQNYVALLQGSKATAGFHSRNLILGMKCFRSIMNV